MSKQSERLFRLLGEADPEQVEQAAPPQGGQCKQPRHFSRWVQVAACFAVASLGLSMLPRVGCGSGGGGGCKDGYMDYAGPVLPLAVAEKTEGLWADRALELDFSGYASPDAPQREVRLTDRYTLKNETDEAKTLTLVYPYAGDCAGKPGGIPSVKVDGVETEVQLYAGPLGPDDWQGWAELAEHGIKDTLSPPAPLEGSRVVYTISHRSAPNDKDIHFQCVSGWMDQMRSGCLTYGFNSGWVDEEKDGLQKWRFGADCSPANAGQNVYLLMQGEDLKDPEFSGWTRVPDQPPDYMDPQVTGTLTRQELALDPVIENLARQYWQKMKQDNPYIGDPAALPLYLQAVRRIMQPPEQCIEDFPSQSGMLEDRFGWAMYQSRLQAAAFEVTIPAGGEMQIQLVVTKPASRNFVGKQQDQDGYELLPQFDSSLAIRTQTVTLAGLDAVTLAGQNFGFDPEQGVTTVTLDPSEPMYFIRVEKKPQVQN